MTRVYKRDEFEVRALDDVTLKVPEARFVAIMGPSGSDKITMLNLIGGIDHATSGHVQLMSAFAAAIQSGDLNALTQMLASDVRVITDGGGKVAAALNVVQGADSAAQFLVSVTRKYRSRPKAAGSRRVVALRARACVRGWQAAGMQRRSAPVPRPLR